MRTATRETRNVKSARPGLKRGRDLAARLKLSQEREAATAEILRVISRSRTDIQPVLDAVAESAARLCGATDVIIRRLQGDDLRMVAHFGSIPVPPQFIQLQLSRRNITGRAILERKTVHVADIHQADVRREFPDGLSASRKGVPWRTVLAVPLLREGAALGVIIVRRAEVKPFTSEQVALLETFAHQAVIAMENVRLFNETKEALERQTATAEILAVISRTPTDTQPVFDSIVKNCARLFGVTRVGLWLIDADQLVCRAGSTSYPSEAMPIDRESGMGSCVLAGRILHLPDLAAVADQYPRLRQLGLKHGYGSGLYAPLMREGRAIGGISVLRRDAGAFSDKDVEVLSTFASQAVIAIENVRLFNETKEALEQQTATSDILKVISRSTTDVQPVFDTIAQNARQLLNGSSAGLILVEAGAASMVALSTVPGAEEYQVARKAYPMSVEKLARERPQFVHVLESGRPASMTDMESEQAGNAPLLAFARSAGIRSNAVVPMLREGEPIGLIVVNRREPHATTPEEFRLLETFASQAVIAIGNTRLFNETKEALEQQTAISEVLRVISSSPSDVTPVLQAVADRAMRICESKDSRIFLVDGNELRYVAGGGDVGIGKFAYTRPLDRGLVMGRAVIDRRPVHVDDLAAAGAEYPHGLWAQQKWGHRTTLAVPLLREGKALGAILLRRLEVRPFSPQQIALLQTFADQAAIAIENARLFNETKEALEQQKASGEVLAAISSSIADTSPVFDKILEGCERLFQGQYLGIGLATDDGFVNIVARRGLHITDDVTGVAAVPLSKDSGSGLAILERRIVHLPDVAGAADVPPVLRRNAEKVSLKSIIFAPMFWDDKVIGTVYVGRRLAGAFTEKQIALLKTFADQAVIAIQNARLFQEIQEKSRQLEEASKHKSQFLASMSHELRTPLNAILGFNEMILGGIYGDVPGEMTEPLKDIQTSGKHLLRLINNVLDLAKIEAGRMELALGDYLVQDTVAGVHATLRPLAAEKGLEFVTEVSADIPLAHGDAGRIAQCLMNLAGNSLKFTKHGRVAIVVEQADALLRYSVTDTGIGIPPDKIGSLFTEFKQTDATIASEFGGTGLGLSISKKFIEMHGGRIWVESEPGKGSAFRFEVPLRAGL
jgi:GAF domain-containing protein